MTSPPGFAPDFAPVVVIGGGIVGLSAAYHLAAKGIEVVVLERAAGPVEASVRNAGGIRAQCRNAVERSLAMAAIELWRKLAADSGRDIEYQRSGNLRLAMSDTTLAALAAESEAERSAGLRTEVWEARELRRRAPYVSDRFIGAKYCATDGHANPIQATWAMREAAASRGANLITDVDVRAIEVEAGEVRAVRAEMAGRTIRIRTEEVVHAAGPWTADLAASIGVAVPLTPARNAIFVSQATSPMFAEFISSHELQTYARQARAGHIHVGGVFTVDGTYDQTVTRSELGRLARIRDIVPAVGSLNVLRAWAGTLDLTPDRLPVVGRPGGLSGYVVAAGFSGHGFCLGPIVGRLISELVTHEDSSIDIDALHPDRFATAGAA